MNQNVIKYVLNVFIIVLLIFALIVFMNTIGINLNMDEHPKKLLQVVTIEGLENSIKTGADAFCESYKGSSGDLNTSCGKLTNKNCNATSCCILSSDKKCVAGNADGPTYNTDSNGKTINLDYYYYQNKCYGDKCPDKIKKMIILKNKQNNTN
jgi:hypothetical protein